MGPQGALLDHLPTSPRHFDVHRTVGPVLVSAAYYLGAQLGFALQAPDAPQSVLWLPNSILLAVLLAVPYRAWAWYLIGAFPAQMLVAWGAGAPPLTLALLFATNCADAALGAFLARRTSGVDGPFRFDGLRSTVIFAAFGAALPTLLLSFADAGISVATGWSASYGAAFITRVRSNVLTHLIVVPALIDLSAIKWRRLRTRRVCEAVGLTVMVTLACVIAFGHRAPAGAFPALLYAPLPLLLWAAVRFGPGGIGWSSLVVATVASWVALRSGGLFTARSPLEAVVALQLFLLASATPLLFLAAVVRERDRATTALRENEAALRVSYARARMLAGRLIAAQETERARIARDMHDDFNQQLAALSIAISALRQQTSQTDTDLRERLRLLQARTVSLTDQVRHFSHDLHPGLLDQLGLAGALRKYCAQIAEQNRIELSLSADESVGEIPREVAVCIYRIVQEGVRNVIKHAGVAGARVVLARGTDHLDVTITDSGRGFEPSAALALGGIGLLSVEERARLVGGSMTVVSAPGRGTRLSVHIPLMTVWHNAGSLTPA